MFDLKVLRLNVINLNVASNKRSHIPWKHKRFSRNLMTSTLASKVTAWIWNEQCSLFENTNHSYCFKFKTKTLKSKNKPIHEDLIDFGWVDANFAHPFLCRLWHTTFSFQDNLECHAPRVCNVLPRQVLCLNEWVTKKGGWKDNEEERMEVKKNPLVQQLCFHFTVSDDTLMHCIKFV